MSARHRHQAVLLAGAALASLSFAQAYAAEPASAAADGPEVELEAVIVTAERRAAPLQDVPLSVASVSGEALADSNFRVVTDLQYLVPGVQFDTTNGSAFQIRGVGSTSWDYSNEKSVSLVVDDVVMDAQRDNGLLGLTDIAQIDVLKGPQGTLFGKNATSGVIAVTTAQPDFGGVSAKGEVSYGERADRAASVTVNAPLGEELALRVSVFAQGQEGPGRYTVLDRPFNSFEDYGYRAKLLFRPNDRVEVTYAHDYGHHWDNNNRTTVGGGSAAFTALQIANGVTPSLTNDDSADSHKGKTESSSWGHSLRGEVQIGRDTLTSVTAYRDTRFTGAGPGNFAPTDKWAFVPFNEGTLKTWKFSQELRWASPTGGFVEYLAGLFYNRLDQDATQIQWVTFGVPLVTPAGTPLTSYFTTTGVAGDPGNAVRYRTTNISTAAFGQLKFNLTPRLTASLGARYTRDDNSQGIDFFWMDPVPFTGVPVTFTPTGRAPLQTYGQVEGENISYRISGQYRLSDDAMAYATYATGYKPGGAAFVGNNYSPYGDETVESLEVGVKSEFFDRRVRLNLDLFRSEFTDFQTSLLTFVPGNPVSVIAVGNAGGLRSQGAEASFAWRVTPSLTVDGGLTYLDAEFTDYVYNATTDYSGTALSNAPKWQGAVGLDYDGEIGSNMRLRASFDYAYRSKVWSQIGERPDTEVPGFGMANGRVSLSPVNSDFEFGVYGRNLFDEYLSTAFEQYSTMSLTHRISRDAHRTVGVFARYAF